MSGQEARDYIVDGSRPSLERLAGTFIQTQWTCTHCGHECDVWGVADNEWMDCDRCGKASFLVAGLPEPGEVATHG